MPASFTGARCPVCAARVGVECTDFLGRPRGRSHDDRLLADLEVDEEIPTRA